MPRHVITLSSLNLHHFHEWDRRMPLIVEALHAVDADVVFFQQAEKDALHGAEDQVSIINSMAGYPHAAFFKNFSKTERKGIKLPVPVECGLGVLSKVPFSSSTRLLSDHPSGKEQRMNVECEFDFGGKTVKMVNVHFWNTDSLSEANLRETLSFYGDERPIIAGDMNIKSLSRWSPLYRDSYVASSDQHGYISHPADNETYDYMLIPKTMQLKRFECLDRALSDHRMIVADIAI